MHTVQTTPAATRPDTDTKNRVLADLAQLLDHRQDEIIAQNQLDLAAAGQLDPTLTDRLKVDRHKVVAMQTAVTQVQSFDDPEGRVLSRYQHPNGMVVENRQVPFGTLLIIYESRPDVTIEAAVSAFKAGNRILLKGGREALRTNLALVACWHQALARHNLDAGWVTYLHLDRAQTRRLVAENSHRVDLIIPRGGEGLINYLRQEARVPLLVSGRGNNFLYVHAAADPAMATALIRNGKQRLSVCNAIDKVLLDAQMPGFEAYVSALLAQLGQDGLVLYGDDQLRATFPQLAPVADAAMYDEEFLDARLLLAVVAGPDPAIEMINRHGGGHSAVIVTADVPVANHFQQQVDSAAVYHNASSRFTDGGQFGFGAEMAISTQKLHFRGPVGLAQLVTNKWFISGQGQTRP